MKHCNLYNNTALTPKLVFWKLSMKKGSTPLKKYRSSKSKVDSWKISSTHRVTKFKQSRLDHSQSFLP